MQKISQTLLEQMHFTEAEISLRRRLLNLTEEDAKHLMQCKPIIHEAVDSIVSEFYEKQIAIDEVALLIGDAETLDRLRKTQKKYILELFDGFYDAEYVKSRLRIGLVHKRIGVEPKLYLAATMELKTLSNRVIVKNVEAVSSAAAARDALDKLLYFDITLVVDTYYNSFISEVELARNRAESYASTLEEEIAERTRQLEQLSRRDGLTDLYNQRSFLEFLRRDFLNAERSKLPLSLVYFDVDKFKSINDTLGHRKGDEILKSVGSILLEISRNIDVPCRYGGDEFCVILPNCTAENAREYCARLISAFSKRHKDISLSIGVAQTGPETFDSPDALIKHADRKMYKAKATPGFQAEG